MAPVKTGLEVIIAGDSKQLQRAFAVADHATDRFGKKMARSAQGIAGAVGVAFATEKILQFGLDATKAASDVSESLSKNQVLFGKYSKAVEKFSDDSAAAFGISKRAALEYTGVFGNLFSAIGVSADESAKFSVSITKLAADMASFNNTSIEDALEAIRAGLVGETEPLRKFGVNLNDATMRQEAMALGLTKSTKNVLTPYQKAMAAQALIVKQTEKAHGDFARTSSGAANQQRILGAQIEDLKVKLGEKLLPVQKEVLTALNKFVTGMQDGTGAGGKFAKTAEEIWTELQPMLRTTKDVVVTIAKFVAKNPEIVKVAAGFAAVGLAVKGITFASKISGLSTFLSAAKTGARTFQTIWSSAGTLAGQAASAKTGEALADNLPGSVRARRVSIRGAGRIFGGIFAAGAVAVILAEIGSVISKTFDPNGNQQSIDNYANEAAKSNGGTLGKIVGGIKDAQNKAAGLIGKLNPLGDGTGYALNTSGYTPPSGGSQNLMGASSDLSGYASMASNYGLRVSSGHRPGAITNAGNRSYHASGRAIDVAGSPSSMMAFAKHMASAYGGQLEELIYTPMGFSIKNGQRVAPYAQADHYDHVHIADTGKFGGAGKAAKGGSKDLGVFVTTAYGPPWNAMNGTGVTSTGVDLRDGKRHYIVAVDPSVIPYGTKLVITPNPYNYSGTWTAADTGGAIRGNRIDFYVSEGRSAQNAWGRRKARVKVVGKGTVTPSKKKGVVQTLISQRQAAKALREKVAARTTARADRNAGKLQKVQNFFDLGYALSQTTTDPRDDLVAANAGLAYANTRVASAAALARAGMLKDPSILTDAMSSRDEWQGRINDIAQNSRDLESAVMGTVEGALGASSGAEPGVDVGAILAEIRDAIDLQNKRAAAIGTGAEGKLAMAVTQVVSGQIGGTYGLGYEAAGNWRAARY